MPCTYIYRLFNIIYIIRSGNLFMFDRDSNLLYNSFRILACEMLNTNKLNHLQLNKEFSYEKTTFNSREGICHTGKNQAPIDIKNAISTDDLPAVTFNYVDKTTGFVVNNGHSIQFNLKKPETIKLGDHTLELVQLHFHSPSENTIDGKSFPLEMHLVHKDAQGNLAVVAESQSCKENLFEEAGVNLLKLYDKNEA